jgi:hypothetical protein
MAKYKTIGAISGHFPTAAQRKLNEQLADLSYGAESRAALEAEMLPGGQHVGICAACDTHISAPLTMAECPCCEMWRRDPSMTIHTDGTWWDVSALAEAIAAGEA